MHGLIRMEIERIKKIKNRIRMANRMKTRISERTWWKKNMRTVPTRNLNHGLFSLSHSVQ